MPKTFDELLALANAAKPETISQTLEQLLPEIYAADLLDPEIDVLFEAVRNKTKARVSGLRSAWQKYLATRDVQAKQEAAGAPVPPEINRAADELLRDPKLLERAITTIGKLGVVGEKANRGTLYCTLTSRLMPEPISALLKGRSASGKSNLVKQALKLMPPESYYEFTAMSAKALIYADELDLRHKHLIIFEEDGNEEAEYLVRTLLSEGRISYLTAEKGAKGITSRHIEREGPTGLITTLTRASVREDNETRAWSLYVDDSKDQTLRVVTSLANTAAQGQNDSPDTRPWQVAQRKLVSKVVLIPFAPVMAELLRTEGLPSDTTRLRRDFGRLLTLVKVITLLYQYQRDQDAAGHLVATLDDYRMAYDLVATPFAESARDLSPQALKLAKAIRELYNPEDAEPVTPRQLEGHLRWSRATVMKWLTQAEAAGLAEVEAGKGNKASQIKPIGEVPDQALELLPTPEALSATFYASPPPKRLNTNEKTRPENRQGQDNPAFNPPSTAFSAFNAFNPDDSDELNALNAPKRKLNTENDVRDAKEENKDRVFKRLGEQTETKETDQAEPWVMELEP